MIVAAVDSWREKIPLKQPYRVASGSAEHADLFLVRMMSDTGLRGLGSAAPFEVVTGESVADCGSALSSENLLPIVGRNLLDLDGLQTVLDEVCAQAPAARAALDMAAHDLVAQSLGVPLVDYLGRRHRALPTSVTIGIKSPAETLEEAREYLDRGFRCLKVKVGLSIEEDLERLHLLRESLQSRVLIRVDANQGYGLDDARRLLDAAGRLDIELVEQPVPPRDFDLLRTLPEGLRRLVAADESVHDARDAFELSQAPAACQIINIKLMKSGGIAPALSLGEAAQRVGFKVMWGCMDESVISIAAACHAAYSCPATRYLDLDGSFDLKRDPARGGFVLRDGCLHLLEKPGLGVELTQPGGRGRTGA